MIQTPDLTICTQPLDVLVIAASQQEGRRRREEEEKKKKIRVVMSEE